jgi:hypothetical protein
VSCLSELTEYRPSVQLVSHMSCLSELTKYRPSDQVYVATIIVAQQLGRCKLVGQKRGSFTFYTRARRVRTDSGPRPHGQSEQAPGRVNQQPLMHQLAVLSTGWVAFFHSALDGVHRSPFLFAVDRCTFFFFFFWFLAVSPLYLTSHIATLLTFLPS